MGVSLHLRAAGADIHLALPTGTRADDVLSICADAMRDGRVVDFPDTQAPGAVRRSTVLINFEHVSAVWVDADHEDD
jgi:hypothetical protein